MSVCSDAPVALKSVFFLSMILDESNFECPPSHSLDFPTRSKALIKHTVATREPQQKMNQLKEAEKTASQMVAAARKGTRAFPFGYEMLASLTLSFLPRPISFSPLTNHTSPAPTLQLPTTAA